MQLPMFVFGCNSCDLVIYCDKEMMIVNVARDDVLIKEIVLKSAMYFTNILLPEIVTRKSDPSNNNDREVFCLCKRPSFGLMMTCSGISCDSKWFHYKCIGITRAIKGKWKRNAK